MVIGFGLAGLRVLVTGHTGFKGGWLSLWLQQIGAEVHGISLAPDTNPNLHNLLDLRARVASRLLDIRHQDALHEAINEIRPQVVFHLAAQPLVRRSYRQPVETFATNVLGTVHLLEACRTVRDLRAVVCVTTDKVYENQEWAWPYREIDPLGGKDPYSASKAATEIAVRAYQRSFFAERGVPVVTARGGNVIGGGDYSEDRIVPDILRALAQGKPLDIRLPDAVRPWQHVLTLCHGYLRLAEAAMAGEISADSAWNFGPAEADIVRVRALVERFAALGLAPELRFRAQTQMPESRLLRLDSSRARGELGWRPGLHLDETVQWTVDWYRSAMRGDDMAALSLAQIEAYTRKIEALC